MIIERTLNAINLLPVIKAEEISDFADFLTKKHQDQLLIAGIEQLNLNSKTFNCLKEDPELYTTADLKK